LHTGYVQRIKRAIEKINNATGLTINYLCSLQVCLFSVNDRSRADTKIINKLTINGITRRINEINSIKSLNRITNNTGNMSISCTFIDCINRDVLFYLDSTSYIVILSVLLI